MSKRNLPQSASIDNSPTAAVFGNGPPSDNGLSPTTGAAAPSNGQAPDPFDPAGLRLSQDFSATLGVKEVLVSVPVEKPKGEWWVPVHPSASYSLETAVIELKEDREVFLVAPPLWSGLADEPTFSPRALFTAINRQGRLFLWHCRLPGPDGKTPDWITLPLEAVRQAKVSWTRFFWDDKQRRHRIKTTEADWEEPSWPDLDLAELLKLAFKDRFIQEADHPVLRKLRGEV